MRLSTVELLSQAMLFVALVSGGNAHLCLFVPNPVPYRIYLVPLYRPVVGCPAHPFGTKSVLIEHRLCDFCLAHDPTHMQLRVCSSAQLSTAAMIIRLGRFWPVLLALSRTSITVSRRRMGEKDHESTNQQQQRQRPHRHRHRHHKQAHRPTVYKLPSRPFCP